MSFNINEIVDNYRCPCHTHGIESNCEITVKDQTKFFQCATCSYSWGIFLPNPLKKCLSCRGTFYEIVVIPELCSVFRCYFCSARIPEITILGHYQKIVSLHLNRKSEITLPTDTQSVQCSKHNWSYRFLNGEFQKSCSLCGIKIVLTDPKEISLNATEFLNCCENIRTGFSCFRYLNNIILQCNECMSETVVTNNEAITDWLSGGQWGIGFVQQEIRSIKDLHVGDHLAYIRKLYEHHVIVVWVDAAKGMFKQVGFTGPSIKSKDDMSLEGKVSISEKIYNNIEDLMVIILYLPLDCFHVGQVIHRALSRIEESDYNLITNNCEHMATWCKYGVFECVQVKKVLEKYTKIGQTFIETHFIPPVQAICYKASQVANEDPTIAHIHDAVVSQHRNIKEKLKNTLSLIYGETKPMEKEKEPEK